ncbi:OB-fold nucleic acid binding domain-containing protein [Candidatus Woesearchaeota archaeon]|nr:OB-fold nucleic acid binding domain-containing protein [Candidatus Woesearchaeota archaeon]
MVDDSTLVRSAMVSIIIGLSVLFFISKSITVDERDIGSLNDLDIEKAVLVRGTVKDIRADEGFSVFTIRKTEEISVVVFKNITMPLGSDVLVYGTVDEYNGELEIIADRIEVV